MAWGRQRPQSPPAPAASRRTAAWSAPAEFPSWPLLALAAPIGLRAALFVVALMVEPWTGSASRAVPAWAQLLQSACFGMLAFVLLRYGRHDRRAWSLGLFVLDAASTLVTQVLRSIPSPALLTIIGLHIRTDAFQAAMIWYFASLFPRSSTRTPVAVAFLAGTVAAFGLGIVLVAADVVANLTAGARAGWFVGLASALQRESPGSSDWYFTLQFLALVPLLVLMPLKLRESGPDGRRRFLLLTLGICLGFLPLVVNTLLVTVVPGVRAGDSPIPVPLIVASLTAVPIAGAYAALVQRTLDIRLVLRQALQYVLARTFLRALAVAPVVAFVALVAVNREEPVSRLVTGQAGALLLGLAATAAATAAGRRRVLSALDRRFFREAVDGKATLLAVSEGVRHADSIEDVRGSIADALERAFHAETVVTAVVGSDDALHAIDADMPPLRRASALAQLIGGNDRVLVLGSASREMLDRLNERDRAWLAAANAEVLVPLRGTHRDLLGLVALGAKQSELPYSAQDGELLAAIGMSAGFALDRILTMARNTEGPGLPDPPARECTQCGTVWGADVARCGCGAVLERASAPFTLRDRYQFVRRLGAGGMGVVYAATDLRLGRPMAIKTLATSDPVMIARLRREAELMASVSHAHLATLHGLEVWRQAPLLVMEFLDGGTLADRLRQGPLPPDEVFEIGAAIAGALGVLHGRRMLHRDVKPSNIGFKADGTPKLLDFGLAKLAPLSEVSTTVGPSRVEVARSPTQLTDSDSLRGTPAYLSPELLAGAPLSSADDLWSLSVTLLEACLGVNPYRCATAASTIAGILAQPLRGAAAAAVLPPRASRVFSRLLGPREARPSSASEMLRALHATP
ncbi:MAG: serine/threonine-protein kinase [Vicinamibacterales bacterium]